MTLTLTATATTRVRPVSAWPANASASYSATPVVSFPDYLATFIDPTFGTRITRICDIADAVHTYPKKQPWNHDETKIMLGLSSGNRVLLRASDYAVLNAAVGGDGNWMPTSVDELLRVTTATGVVFTYNPETNTNTGTVHTFSEYANASQFDFMTQASPSDDGRYWLMKGQTAGGQKTVFVYDLVLDQAVSTLAVTTMPHSGSMSHSGTYIHLNWDDIGTGNEEGIWMLGRDLVRLRQVFRKKQHADFGWDWMGREVFVSAPNSISPEFDTNCYMYRCNDGTATNILTGQTAFRHGYATGRNSNRKGWAYLSVYDTSTGTDNGTDQILAVKLDGSETVQPFAHAHENTTNVAATDAHAVPNRDGSKVLFKSAWGLTDGYEYVAQQ